MKRRDDKLQLVLEWAENNSDALVVLLTSSLVNPLAPVDELSDLDIEIVFENNAGYISDKKWVSKFGILLL